MHSEAMQAMYTECSNIPLPLLYRRKAFPVLPQMLQILEKIKKQPTPKLHLVRSGKKQAKLRLPEPGSLHKKVNGVKWPHCIQYAKGSFLYAGISKRVLQ